MPSIRGHCTLLLEDALDLSLIQKPDVNLYSDKLFMPKNFVGREKELIEIKDLFNETNKVAVVGMRGLGKTYLALQYARLHHSNYSFSYYIQASTACDIKNSLLKLAEKLAIDIREPKEALASLKAKIEQSSSFCLFILDGFDRAQIYKEIKYLIPKKGIHVLVTSQVINVFKPKCTLKLTKWSLEDIANYLKLKQEKSGKNLTQYPEYLQKSIESLDGSPLALYSMMEFIQKGTFHLSTYLKKLDQDFVGLLKACYEHDKDCSIQQAPASEICSIKTIISLLKETIQIMIQIGAHGNLTKEILFFCTFLSRDFIPYEFIQKCISDLKPENSKSQSRLSDLDLSIRSALSILRNYSVLQVIDDNTDKANIFFYKLAEYDLNQQSKNKYYDVAVKSLLFLLNEKIDLFDKNQDNQENHKCMIENYSIHIKSAKKKPNWNQISMIIRISIKIAELKVKLMQKDFQKSITKAAQVKNSLKEITDPKTAELDEENTHLIKEINKEISDREMQKLKTQNNICDMEDKDKLKLIYSYRDAGGDC